MEHQKKRAEIKNEENTEEEKKKFFKQVFKQCCSNFKKKELQFFFQCIVPHRGNSAFDSSNKKLRNSHQSQKQLNINDINPNVLTMERSVPYYEEKKISHLSTQKPNRRILTTPTQKMRKEIKLQNYEDFAFYKKMKQYEKSISVSNNIKYKNHRTNIHYKYNKMYSPQPLFHPNSFIEAPKIVLNFSSKKVGRLCKTRAEDRKKLTQNSKIQFDQTIPDNFAQILRRPINLTTYRPSKTSYPKSMR